MTAIFAVAPGSAPTAVTINLAVDSANRVPPDSSTTTAAAAAVCDILPDVANKQ